MSRAVVPVLACVQRVGERVPDMSRVLSKFGARTAGRVASLVLFEEEQRKRHHGHQEADDDKDADDPPGGVAPIFVVLASAHRGRPCRKVGRAADRCLRRGRAGATHGTALFLHTTAHDVVVALASESALAFRRVGLVIAGRCTSASGAAVAQHRALLSHGLAGDVAPARGAVLLPARLRITGALARRGGDVALCWPDHGDGGGRGRGRGRRRRRRRRERGRGVDVVVVVVVVVEDVEDVVVVVALQCTVRFVREAIRTTPQFSCRRRFGGSLL